VMEGEILQSMDGSNVTLQWVTLSLLLATLPCIRLPDCECETSAPSLADAKPLLGPGLQRPI
jgi:hypothetical protein